MPCALHGHQDTLFTIEADGRLEGVPEKYGPAYLKISGILSSSTPEVVLILGKNMVRMPECIARLFVLPKGEKIIISGSWYHKSKLPPYINFRLPQRTYSYGFADGYEMLFNLETAELIYITKTIVSQDMMSMQDQNIEPSELCKAEEIGAIKILPNRQEFRRGGTSSIIRTN